jgi:hypothetical protein
MPDRNSSNELVWELMREMLAERGRDLSEGLTLRSLERRLAERNAQDDRRFDRFEERLRALEQGQSRIQGHEDRTLTPATAFSPFSGIPVHMGIPPAVKSKRPSLPPWAKAAVRPVAHWVGMVLIAVVVALASRCAGMDHHEASPAPAAPTSTR